MDTITVMMGKMNLIAQVTKKVCLILQDRQQTLQSLIFLLFDLSP